MFKFGKRLKKFLASQRGSATLTTEATVAFVLVGAAVVAQEANYRAECQRSGSAVNSSTLVLGCADVKSCSGLNTKYGETTSHEQLSKLGSGSKDMSDSCKTLLSHLGNFSGGSSGGDGGKDDSKDEGTDGDF